VGSRGSVYLDVPAGGTGEVRVTVSGVVSMVKARALGGQAIKAGTPVRVVRQIEANCVAVEPVGDEAEGTGQTGAV